MGHSGEVSVDQAHRGYTVATDTAGFGSVNPLFWKPTRDAATGEFAGQRCYGYISFEAFVDAAAACSRGKTPADFDCGLPCSDDGDDGGHHSHPRGGPPLARRRRATV